MIDDFELQRAIDYCSDPHHRAWVAAIIQELREARALIQEMNHLARHGRELL